jgi:hypothetical protein
MANFDVITVARRENCPPLNPYVYVMLSEYFKASNDNTTLSAKLSAKVNYNLLKANEQNRLFTN